MRRMAASHMTSICELRLYLGAAALALSFGGIHASGFCVPADCDDGGRASQPFAESKHATGEHGTFERMRSKVAREEALGLAKGELLADDIDGRLHALEREQKINALLVEIKARKGLGA